MATHNPITSTACVALTSAALLGFVATAAQAGPIPSLYHLIFGGDFVPEQITVPHAAPPADPFAGLTEDAERKFLTDHGVASTSSPMTIHASVANGAGYVTGGAISHPLIDTQIVFHDGKVLCCTTDFPYRLTAMNDNGIFIGHDETRAFVGTEITPSWVTPEIPNLDAASVADLETRYGGAAPWQSFWFDADFTAIDNANRIGGDSRFGGFTLNPVLLSAAAVPEPSSWLLLAGFLGWGAWLSACEWRRGKV